MERHDHFRKMWEECADSFPVFGKNYSGKEKCRKEKYLDDFSRELKEGLQEGDQYPGQIDDVVFFKKLKQFFKEGLDYNEEQLSVILSPGMINSTLNFVCEARRFDPSISPDGIFQACRNIWIMNGVQYILGMPVCISSSMFAYSMLYPYTDNFVDDPAISKQEKLEFSYRFAERLKGNFFQAENETEEKIHNLVAMIENEWDRQLYPEVYNSLQAIHEAQTESMLLLSPKKTDENNIFRICVEKGGSSVVADGYLIAGCLNRQQEQFLYDYGAYLQLLDDLQDVAEDLSDGLMTCFSAAGSKGRLDEMLNRTFHLGFRIMDEVDLLNSCNTDAFKSLMKKSIDLFLIEAVVSNYSFFSRSFIHKMEPFSPFRFSYIRKRSSTLSPYQNLLFQNIEEFAIRVQQREPDRLLHSA